MTDPAVGGGVVKAALAVVPMTIKAVAREWKRRDADTRAFGSLERDMEEALDVLGADAAPSPANALNRVKGALSGVPAIFSDSDVLTWIKQAETRSAVKAAVMALVRGEGEEASAAQVEATAPVAEILSSAVRVAFDYAVAFVARSLDRDLSVGDRVTQARIDNLGVQVADLAQSVRQVAAPTGLQLELLDGEATRAMERVRQRRFFRDADRTADAIGLATRLLTGDLSAASDTVRSRGLANCARWLALGDSDDAAKAYLSRAHELSRNEEVVIARAFLESRLGEGDGLKALAPINTDARREAALVIVHGARGAEAALAWASMAGVEPSTLTPDGQQFLLRYAIEANEWTAAYDIARSSTPERNSQSPALLQGAALARLGAAVPPDLRDLVRNNPPFEAATFSLADDPAALEDRRAAAQLFGEAAAATLELGLPQTSGVLAAYALWLRLRDQETASAARTSLVDLLDDPERNLAAIPIAIAFGVTLDRDRVEQALARREALDPEGMAEVAVARFALLNTPKDLSTGLADLRRLKPRLAPFITAGALLSLELALLVELGQADEAAALLESEAGGLDPDQVSRLRANVGQSGAGPTLEALEGWYAEDPNSLNLRRLVERLARGPYAPRFFELARKLVVTTRASSDAEAVVEQLTRFDRHAEAATILAEVSDLVPLSLNLKAAQAWSDYRAGDMAAAWARLTELRAARDDRNDRALLGNILIASGRWPELVGYVETEWEHRASRSAEQLMDLAKLAAALGSQRVGEFVRLAAAAAPDDPDIQIGCYSTAMAAGLEGETPSGEWLQRAIELSDENGPVTQADLQELVDQQGDWRKRVDEVWTKLRQAELPLFVGAQLLRRSGLEMQLAPLILNPSERDPRRRSVVATFSGLRDNISGSPGRIALDGSAVITLGVLGQLQAVVNRPGGVILPHSALSWLFTERQKLRFHQPSRIRDAQTLVGALAAKRLYPFTATTSAPPALVDQIGQDLAEMLESARMRSADDRQHLVVRPGPVTRIGSFVGEEVDLSAFQLQLVSCAAVVEKLFARGHLTSEEDERARNYLAQQGERRWPEEPEVADNAVLYLDDLSVTYLQTVGALDRLHMAGLTAQISAREIDEANALLAMQAKSAEIEAAIELIRKPLAAGVQSGAVRLAPIVDGDDTTAHPNVAVARAAALVDVVVSDERFINKNRFIEDGGHRAEVWTSLELIEGLRRDGNLTDTDLARARHDLRRRGVVFISPTADEFTTLLSRARVRDGVLQETAELRAIRENLEAAQMHGWLYLPTETGWLDRLQVTAVAAIVAQWSDEIADEDARARCEWLLQRADVRNWATFDVHADPTGLATYGLVLPLNRLVLAVSQMTPGAHVQRLGEWLRTHVIEGMRHEDPDAFEWMVGRLRDLILQVATTELPDNA